MEAKKTLSVVKDKNRFGHGYKTTPSLEERPPLQHATPLTGCLQVLNAQAPPDLAKRDNFQMHSLFAMFAVSVMEVESGNVREEWIALDDAPSLDLRTSRRLTARCTDSKANASTLSSCQVNAHNCFVHAWRPVCGSRFDHVLLLFPTFCLSEMNFDTANCGPKSNAQNFRIFGTSFLSKSHLGWRKNVPSKFKRPQMG